MVRKLLADRRARDNEGLYILEGVRLAEEARAAGIHPELVLYSRSLSARGQEIIRSFENLPFDIEEVEADLLDRISDTRNSQGILLTARIPLPALENDYISILALDEIRDPGNLGTLMRSAAALGFRMIALTTNSVDAHSPKVIRAAMGAHFKLDIKTMTVSELADFCKTKNHPTLRILLADSEGDLDCWNMDLSQPVCLVIGGEAQGVSPELRSICDGVARVPMESGSESLNAAVAGSILMYEIYRQRKKR